MTCVGPAIRLKIAPGLPFSSRSAAPILCRNRLADIQGVTHEVERYRGPLAGAAATRPAALVSPDRDRRHDHRRHARRTGRARAGALRLLTRAGREGGGRLGVLSDAGARAAALLRT